MPNPMHYQILCIIGNGMLYMTKQRGNLVNAQPYALPDFMHYLLCIIEISTVLDLIEHTSPHTCGLLVDIANPK